MGLWTDSVRASLAFSATLAVSGALGTPLGGLALDAWTRKRENKLRAALEVSIATVGAGALLITPAAFARDRAWFLASIGLGTLPLFAATSPMNVSIFEGVPREHRAFFAPGVAYRAPMFVATSFDDFSKVARSARPFFDTTRRRSIRMVVL